MNLIFVKNPKRTRKRTSISTSIFSTTRPKRKTSYRRANKHRFRIRYLEKRVCGKELESSAIQSQPIVSFRAEKGKLYTIILSNSANAFWIICNMTHPSQSADKNTIVLPYFSPPKNHTYWFRLFEQSNFLVTDAIPIDRMNFSLQSFQSMYSLHKLSEISLKVV